VSKVCRTRPSKKWLKNNGCKLGDDGYHAIPPDRVDMLMMSVNCHRNTKRGYDRGY
jgi:hypothetical protein